MNVNNQLVATDWSEGQRWTETDVYFVFGAIIIRLDWRKKMNKKQIFLIRILLLMFSGCNCVSLSTSKRFYNYLFSWKVHCMRNAIRVWTESLSENRLFLAHSVADWLIDSYSRTNNYLFTSYEGRKPSILRTSVLIFVLWWWNESASNSLTLILSIIIKKISICSE